MAAKKSVVQQTRRATRRTFGAEEKLKAKTLARRRRRNTGTPRPRETDRAEKPSLAPKA